MANKLIALVGVILATMVSAAGHAQIVNICERTPEVRQAMNIATNCANVDARTLNRIRVLEINGKGLTALRAGDFDGLGGLRHLDLHNNRLTSLPPDIFDELPSLQYL